MSSCSSVDKLETPAGIESSGKFLVIINGDGVPRKLDLGDGGLVYSDGVNVYFITGTTPFSLPGLLVEGAVSTLSAVIGLNGAGRVLSLTDSTATRKYLSSLSGVLTFQEIDVIPDTGNGFIIRQPSSDVSFAENEGLYWVNNTGTVTKIDLGSEGTILTMTGGVPIFQSMGGGQGATGASSIGLDGVYAKRTSSDQVAISIPRFTVSDGAGDEVTYETISLTLDIDSGVDLNGTDDTLTNNSWYYIYIISDGTPTPTLPLKCVASLSGTAPDLSDPNFDGYTHWGLCSVCRYRTGGSKIVKFIQQGRRFVIERQVILTDKSVTTSWAYIPETKQDQLFTATIPPITKAISGIVGGSGSGSGGNVSRAMAVASTSDPLGEQYIGSKPVGLDIGADGFMHDVGTFTDLLVNDATNGDQIMAWRADSANSFRKLAVSGYVI